MTVKLLADTLTIGILQEFQQVRVEEHTLITQEGGLSNDGALIRGDQYSLRFGGVAAVWLTVAFAVASLSYKLLQGIAGALGEELGKRIAAVIKGWRKQRNEACRSWVLEFRFDDVTYTVQLDERSQEEIILRPTFFVSTIVEIVEDNKGQGNKVVYFDTSTGQWKV